MCANRENNGEHGTKSNHGGGKKLSVVYDSFLEYTIHTLYGEKMSSINSAFCNTI